MALRDIVSNIVRLYFYLAFILNRVGGEYGIGAWQKLKLFRKVQTNIINDRTGSTLLQHILLIEQLLKVPARIEGDVVECGCWKGASAASLSLACALVGRKLIICDSFQGLPEPKNDEERYDIHAGSKEYFIWEKGEFACNLDTVHQNITLYGDITVCEFVKGYFEHTLQSLESESIVFIFEDADLVSSVESCLQYLWPKLQVGCRFYCDEPWSEQVVALFYDKHWWRETLDSHIPGFYGSGHGMLAGMVYSGVGYSEKFDLERLKQEGTKKLHQGIVQPATSSSTEA